MASPVKQGPRVALAQLNSELGDVPKNLARAREYVQRAAADHADVILFPEVYLQGYRADEAFLDTAIEADGEVVRELEDMAREHGIHIIMGAARKDVGFPHAIYNSAVFVGPDGLIGWYDKTHLGTFSVYREGVYFAPGRELPVFDTPFGPVGLLICYDADFPEPSRVLALKGAVINFIISAGPASFREGWKKLLFVRAFENAYYTVYCNVAGWQKDSEFFGGSRIVAPTGEVVVAAEDDREDYVVGDIDLSLVARTRQEMHLFADRAKELYGPITE